MLLARRPGLRMVPIQAKDSGEGLAGVGLFCAGDELGWSLCDDAPAAFDEKTLRTLMVVVPQIASAFSNIGLYNHLRTVDMAGQNICSLIDQAVCSLSLLHRQRPVTGENYLH